jgi:hypothetical protein
MAENWRDDSYPAEETEKRREAALKRMLSTPHKPHDELKLGKKPVRASKTRPASKGRVHKGRTRA